MRNRTFTAWVSPVQLQSGELTSSTVMSVSSNILPPNSEELNAVPSVPATTTVGKIETGGEMLATPVEPLAEVLQKVPISDLDDFLTRFRLVKNFALPTTVTTSLPEVV